MGSLGNLDDFYAFICCFAMHVLMIRLLFHLKTSASHELSPLYFFCLPFVSLRFSLLACIFDAIILLYFSLTFCVVLLLLWLCYFSLVRTLTESATFSLQQQSCSSLPAALFIIESIRAIAQQLQERVPLPDREPPPDCAPT